MDRILSQLKPNRSSCFCQCLPMSETTSRLPPVLSFAQMSRLELSALLRSRKLKHRNNMQLFIMKFVSTPGSKWPVKNEWSYTSTPLTPPWHNEGQLYYTHSIQTPDRFQVLQTPPKPLCRAAKKLSHMWQYTLQDFQATSDHD